MMKRKMMLAVAAVALSLGLAGTPASWANSLTEDGVTFDLSGGGGTLTLTITGALDAQYDGVGDPMGWESITHIYAFSLKNIGVDSLSLNGGGWTTVANELNNSGGGCVGGDSGGFCLSSDSGPVALGDPTTTFTMSYGGDLDLTNPHLKVFFMNTDQMTCTGPEKDPTCEYRKTGSLLSADIPGNQVPEPASLMLLGAGLAGLGIWRRKQA